MEENFACSFIQTMLSLGNYTLQGIARYTNTPEVVLLEIIDGRNPHPSALFLRKLIELDRSQRRDKAHAIFWGLSPLIVFWSIEMTGLKIAPAIYILFFSSFALLLFLNYNKFHLFRKEFEYDYIRG